MHFAFHLRSSPDLGSKANTAQAQLSYLKKNVLIETFPNVAIIHRIYVTLPVANTEDERSFSVLKKVKKLTALIPDAGSRLQFRYYGHQKEFHKICEI